MRSFSAYRAVLEGALDYLPRGVFWELARAKDEAIGNDCLVVEGAWGRRLGAVDNLTIDRHVERASMH